MLRKMNLQNAGLKTVRRQHIYDLGEFVVVFMQTKRK